MYVNVVIYFHIVCLSILPMQIDLHMNLKEVSARNEKGELGIHRC